MNLKFLRTIKRNRLKKKAVPRHEQTFEKRRVTGEEKSYITRTMYRPLNCGSFQTIGVYNF